MEILGGLLAAFVAMLLLAGVGLAALLALASMVVLHFLTEMSFRRVFFVSAGIGLLAPLLAGLAIGGAVADGSLERDLRDELGGLVQLPPDAGDQWREVLPKLRELGEASERGELTEDEAEARAREILGELEDLRFGIDINGDGVVIGGDADAEGDDAGDTGVPLELPEGVEVGADPSNSEQ